MKIVIAMDSFKGSLTAREACNAVARGIKTVHPHAETIICPMADGGEGMTEQLVENLGGKYESVWVTGPLGAPVQARYGILPDRTAVIEMAQAAGLTLVEEKERNPMYTTTYGVGQMIKDAMLKGCREFIIGIGGSATNDGGIGMLQALGFQMLDVDGYSVPYGAKALQELVTIDTKQVLTDLFDCHFRVACDVDNPLLGKNGCSTIYGPQKGASEEDVVLMDAWMLHYADWIEVMNKQLLDKFRTKYKAAYQEYGANGTLKNRHYPGTGAAGGLGYAFLMLLNANLQSGASLIAEYIGLEEKAQNADYIVTGEGCLDAQSIHGKVPMGVARVGMKLGIPVYAVAGLVGDGAEACLEHGVCKYYQAKPEEMSLELAMERDEAYYNVVDASAEMASVFQG